MSAPRRRRRAGVFHVKHCATARQPFPRRLAGGSLRAGFAVSCGALPEAAQGLRYSGRSPRSPVKRGLRGTASDGKHGQHFPCWSGALCPDKGKARRAPRGPEAQRPRGPEAQRPQRPRGPEARGPEAQSQRPRGPEAQSPEAQRLASPNSPDGAARSVEDTARKRGGLSGREASRPLAAPGGISPPASREPSRHGSRGQLRRVRRRFLARSPRKTPRGMAAKRCKRTLFAARRARRLPERGKRAHGTARRPAGRTATQQSAPGNTPGHRRAAPQYTRQCSGREAAGRNRTWNFAFRRSSAAPAATAFTRAATAATCWWTRASPARAWWPNCARSASIRRSSPACSSPTNTSTTYAAWACSRASTTCPCSPRRAPGRRWRTRWAA